MTRRVRLKVFRKRDNPEFMQFLKEHCSVNEHGVITAIDCYAYLGFNVCWKGQLISVTYANAVWFLTHGEWPKSGNHIDHINDNALDNRPVNLQEITEAENHKKRRGRKVYSSYGRGKYGYGLYIHADKRDKRFYVSRNISRGFGNGDLKGIKVVLGGYDSLKEDEACVNHHISLIKEKGVNYIPNAAERKPKRVTAHLAANYEAMRKMRKAGMTFQKIADYFGVGVISVYNRTKDIT